MTGKSTVPETILQKLLWITLSAGIVLSQATTAQAQDTIGNEVFQFPVDTTVEFEFKETHGANQSSLGIVNLDTNETTVLFQETKPYDEFGVSRFQTPSPNQNNIGSLLDFLGTIAGGTVQNGSGSASPFTEYTFRANTRYAFYLESVTPTGQTRRTLRSGLDLTAALNGTLDGGEQGDVTGVRIALDDNGLPRPGKDNDFDDFVIEAGGFLITVACPPIR